MFGALLSTMLGATIGVMSLCISGTQPWSAYRQLWWTWWLGDAVGAMLVAPALLTLGAWPRLRRDGRVAEAAVLLMGLLSVSIAVFVSSYAGSAPLYTLEYTVFPFLIWAAIRFGIAGAAMANVLASAIAVWGTVHGWGPYGVGEVGERLMLLQIFMGIVAGTGLLLGAAVSERDASARRRRVEHAITQVLAEASDALHRDAADSRSDRRPDGMGSRAVLEPRSRVAAPALREHLAPAAGAGFRVRAHQPRDDRSASGVGLPGRVWASDAPSWLIDVPRDPAFARLNAAAAEGLRGAFACPVGVGGDLLGVLEFFYRRSVRQPDADLLQMFMTIGAEVGQFLTRKQVEQDVAESEARKAGILEAVLDCIITIDHRGRIVEFNPAAERTFRYKRSEVIGHEMAQLIIPPALRAAHREGLARYLAAGTGGAIDRRFETTAMRADGTEFPVELSLVRIPSAGPPMFTGFLRDITVQKRMLEQLSFRAAHDGLTQSLNRTAFMDRLRIAVNRAREGEPSIAVLFADIDQFKAINDRYGHAVGDQLLIAMAGRLHGCVRPTDTVARLGGDEFAILIEDVTTHAEVATVAERITKRVGIAVQPRRHFRLGDGQPRHRLRLIREPAGRSPARRRPRDVSRERDAAVSVRRRTFCLLLSSEKLRTRSRASVWRAPPRGRCGRGGRVVSTTAGAAGWCSTTCGGGGRLAAENGREDADDAARPVQIAVRRGFGAADEVFRVHGRLVIDAAVHDVEVFAAVGRELP